MLIAIEGAPRTGKSALARALCDELPAIDAHGAPGPFNSLRHYEDCLSFYDPLGEESVVLDGSYLGELLWPEIFRLPTDMVDPAIRRHIEMFMCSRGCVTIYATRDYTELHADLTVNPGSVRPASLALVLKRYEQALSESHSRGFVFEHDATNRPLTAQDVAFVAGQADDDVRPRTGITRRWIGNPTPRWIIATSGYSDQEIPGRLEGGLNVTVWHMLRCIPERAGRGVLLVDILGMSDEGLYEFSRLTENAESWITIGDDAHDRVQDIVNPIRTWSPGYAVAYSDDLRNAWNLWSEI